MSSKIFTTDYLESIGIPFDNDEVVKSRTLHTRHRWYNTYELVFEDGGKHWLIYYDVGATENQEIDLWGYNQTVYGREVEERTVCVPTWVDVLTA